MSESRFLEVLDWVAAAQAAGRWSGAVGRAGGSSAIGLSLAADAGEAAAADGGRGGVGWRCLRAGDPAACRWPRRDRGGARVGGEGDRARGRRASSDGGADRHRRRGAAGFRRDDGAGAMRAAMPEIAALAAKLDPPRGLARTIGVTFDASGEISDAASPELARLRRSARGWRRMPGAQ